MLPADHPAGLVRDAVCPVAEAVAHQGPAGRPGARRNPCEKALVIPQPVVQATCPGDQAAASSGLASLIGSAEKGEARVSRATSQSAAPARPEAPPFAGGVHRHAEPGHPGHLAPVRIETGAAGNDLDLADLPPVQVGDTVTGSDHKLRRENRAAAKRNASWSRPAAQSGELTVRATCQGPLSDRGCLAVDDRGRGAGATA